MLLLVTMDEGAQEELSNLGKQMKRSNHHWTNFLSWLQSLEEVDQIILF